MQLFDYSRILIYKYPGSEYLKNTRISGYPKLYALAKSGNPQKLLLIIHRFVTDIVLIGDYFLDVHFIFVRQESVDFIIFHGQLGRQHRIEVRGAHFQII